LDPAIGRREPAADPPLPADEERIGAPHRALEDARIEDATGGPALRPARRGRDQLLHLPRHQAAVRLPEGGKAPAPEAPEPGDPVDDPDRGDPVRKQARDQASGTPGHLAGEGRELREPLPERLGALQPALGDGPEEGMTLLENERPAPFLDPLAISLEDERSRLLRRHRNAAAPEGDDGADAEPRQ